MELRLVRTPDQHDRAYVRLDDGQTRSWTFPSYGVMLPHDLVHLLVEVGFGIQDGFWGRVAAGSLPRHGYTSWPPSPWRGASSGTRR